MRINADHLSRINSAVNFINEHPSEDLSLDRLAHLVNYSAFHFQKLFRTVTGETPKQYVLRTRLETAAHAIVMFPHKSITEIALDSGFSTPAIFSRAFRNYFGISPQELRHIPHEERYKLYRQGNFGWRLLDSDSYFFDADNDPTEDREPLNIRVTKLDTIRGIFVSSSLNSQEGITRALKKVSQLAETHDRTSSQTKFLGALYPHQKLYQAIATVEPEQAIPRELSEKEIPAGKFATITISGPVKNTFATMRAVARQWLPASGYRIADIFGLELFSTNPAVVPYEEIERDLHIRIEPAP